MRQNFRPRAQLRTLLVAMILGRQDLRFLEIAAFLGPDLKTKVELPTAIITVVKDKASVMGWKVGGTAPSEP